MGNWNQPQEVSDQLMAFPAIDEQSELLPSMKDIPRDYPDRKRWLRFQQDWFFRGKFPDLLIKEGVDPNKAYRHLCCLQSTFGIKHEHKEAAVAWLASKWFAGFADDKGQEPS